MARKEEKGEEEIVREGRKKEKRKKTLGKEAQSTDDGERNGDTRLVYKTGRPFFSLPTKPVHPQSIP